MNVEKEKRLLGLIPRVEALERKISQLEDLLFKAPAEEKPEHRDSVPGPTPEDQPSPAPKATSKGKKKKSTKK